MAETSKINHDHTYDILTALMNICPSSPESDDIILGITSPQPSDASSDSGLALSPMELQSFDIDFTDTSSLDSFDLETIASGCSPTPTDQFFENIGDLNDIDLSFLDGFDSKTLGSLPEISDKNLPQENETKNLENFVNLMDVDDGIVADGGFDMSPQPLSPSTIEKLPVMKTIATVTPIVITEIKPLKSIPAKTGGKEDKLVISEEEKKLLEEEGHILPENVALTKDEEKLLKKVRRKIKNKVSAQESRKKKKEYIDGLELRVKCCTDENRLLQKKVENLEEQNKSLLEQLKGLQELISTPNQTQRKQTSTCILVLLLAFALVAFPFNTVTSPKDNSVADSYATLPVRSRTLLQYNEEKEPPSALNISHYLRAFSIVFSFSSDKPEVDSYTTPTEISFDDGWHMKDESFTKEYTLSE